MRHAARTSASKIGLICLALLFLFGQLRDVLHEAQVRHVRCADHGEWHHAEPAHAVATETAEPIGPVLLATGFDAGHEHCVSIFPQRERSFAWDVRPIVFAPPVERPATVVRRSVPERETIARYRLAPKQSPPSC